MSKICSYAQGFAQMRKASEDNEWNLKLGDLAMIWREGCIIRAQFLQKIKDAYDNNPGLQNLLLDPYFKNIVTEYQDALRDVVATGVQMVYQHLVSLQVLITMIVTVQLIYLQT